MPVGAAVPGADMETRAPSALHVVNPSVSGERHQLLRLPGAPEDEAVCAFLVPERVEYQDSRGPLEFETREVEGAFRTLNISFCISGIRLP